jgi:hypothetical protein
MERRVKCWISDFGCELSFDKKGKKDRKNPAFDGLICFDYCSILLEISNSSPFGSSNSILR